MSLKDEPKDQDISDNIVDDVLSHLPEAAVGHPNDPHRGELLSAEDEKRLDDQGRPITDGLLWSEAQTDLYLVVGVTTVRPKLNKVLIGGAHADVPKAVCGKLHRNLKMTVGVTLGPPAFHCPSWGACLELPSDLGRDRIKQQYIAEWIANTAVEALRMAGVNFKRDPERTDAIGLWVSEAANLSINQAGL